MLKDHNPKLFCRPYTSAKNQIKITNLLSEQINAENVLGCSEGKIKEFYTIELEKDFLAYRFRVLREWIEKNEVYNQVYAANLRKAIKILNVRNAFNEPEREYVAKIDSLDFEARRIRKKIIVDFALEPGEYAWFSVENVSLRQVDYKTETKKLLDDNFKLYVSNKAIVLTNQIYKIRIPYSESLGFKLIKNGIRWYCVLIDFEFATFDNHLLYEYLKGMIFDNLKEYRKRNFAWPNGYLNRSLPKTRQR